MPEGITAEQMPIGLSKRKLRRVFGLGLLYFPSDPPATILIVVAILSRWLFLGTASLFLQAGSGTEWQSRRLCLAVA